MSVATAQQGRTERLRGLLGDVHEWIDALDPEVMQARTAKAHLELLAEITRACEGATTLLAARVAQTRVWADDGARSPAEYLAKATGAPMGQAIGMLETAARLEHLPAIEAALRDGQLSPAQARAVTQAAIADPTQEADLLRTAARSSLRGLQDKARRIEAAANPELTEARYRAAVESRDCTTWIDPDGSGRLAWRGAPDSLAILKSALAPYITHELRAAGKAGIQAPYAHCAADAFVAMAQGAAGTGEHRRPVGGILMKARVDYIALVEGRTRPGDVCEIEGVGPVPVSVMRRLLDEKPMVDAILTRGRDVLRVAKLGRSGDTYLKAAIEWRDTHCAIAGCERTEHLESHHRIPVSSGGATSLEMSLPLCGFHHDRHHHHGYVITGGHFAGFEMHAPGTAPTTSSGLDPPDTG